MAKTKINNDQLQKLEKYNKVDTKSINITGSTEKTNALAWSDEFIVQGTSDGAKSVKASVLQDFFSGIDIATGSSDQSYKLLFGVGGGEAKTVYVDDDTLTWNADSEILTIAGSAKATVLSGSGDSTVHKITMNQLVAATADINGGSVDGATIGAASQSSVKATTLSGSSTLSVVGASTFGNEGKVVIAADGGLTIDHFDAAWTNAGITVADLGTVTTVDINGGSVDGATIGAASQSSVKATTLSGSSTLHVGGVATFGERALTISAAGVLTTSAAITGSSTITADGNIETRGSFIIGNASMNEADLEKLDGITNGAGAAGKALVLDSNADIVSGMRNLTLSGDLTVNGSTTTIDTTHLAIEDSLIELARGSGSAGTRASNSGAGIMMSGSTLDRDIHLVAAADGGRLKVSGSSAVGTGFDIVSGGDYAINGTAVLSATTLTFGSATMVEADFEQVEDITAGTAAANKAVVLDSSKNIATIGTVGCGAITSTGASTFGSLSGSSTLHVGGVATFGDTALTISAAGLLSSSATATLNGITLGTADINGGSIDDATIGATTQSSVKATTLSGSSTLHVGGVATYGNGETTISAAGLLSSSATATFNGVTLGTADINGGSIDDATIGATTQSSVKATTLSGSSTLSLEGVASFGPGAKTVIAVDGGLTIDHFDAAWTNAGITVADLGTVTTVDLNGGSIDGTVIGAAAQAAGEFTTVSGSGNLDMGGEVQLDGVVDATAAPLTDSFYFLDSDGLMKRDVMIDVMKLGMDKLMVEHVYMSSSTEHGQATGSIASTATCSSFSITNGYGSAGGNGIVTASFDVYLNGMLQVQSGSVSNVTAWDYIVTGSGTRVLFEPQDSVAGANHMIDSDDVVVIKYLIK